MSVIQLLGRSSDGNYAHLPKKARGLLAYLAMHCGRTIPRDKLADLLWSASEPEQGRQSLRQSLAALRRALGADARDLIGINGSDVQLTTSGRDDVDVHRFEILAQSTSLGDLVAANQLYRGEFLADFDVSSEPFMDWVRLERTRLEVTACGMLYRLAAAFSNANKYDAAINAAQRLVALDPLREDGHRLLMQLYSDVGRRGEAIRQFVTCSDHLRRELDVAPDEKTIALADAIRTGTVTRSRAQATSIANTATDQDAAAFVAVADTTGFPPSDTRLDDGERDAAADRTQHETRPSLHPVERRQLTAMASELAWVGARPTAEDLPEVTETCYRRCAQLIEQHHGYVARCAGDGLLAYFGYPHAREEDAENSVRAALALQGLGTQLSVEFGADMQPCVGIATGIVIIGDELKAGGHTASGEALTLSNRLLALAKPGQIIIAHSTRRLLGRFFEYHDLGRVALKGFETPIEIAQVLSESSIESRFEALHPARLTPLVGREEEIELLLRRWRQAKDGDGSAVLLVGEPGIGKSRIAQTVLTLLGRETHALLRLFCSPHHRDSPLYPFVNQLERAAGLRRGDSNERRLIQLEACMQATGDFGNAMPLLAQLLSIPTGDRYPLPTLTPPQRKEKTLEALAAYVDRLATLQPLLLVFEDVHWADPTSLELIDLIVERVPQRRSLLILTARPEFVSPWTGRIQTTSVALGRLMPRQCESIIAGVVQGKSLPKAISKEIVERADGIPLFIEELTKAVLESGALADARDHDDTTGPRPTPEIPMTLHASLLARLDRIGPGLEIVQIGAALGRHFSHTLISAVAAIPQQLLDEALAGLLQAELIWRRGSPPDAEYTFKHALVQDAAYGTLRREPRRSLHARIAETLECQFPDIADTQPELLAHHYSEAGLIEKATELWGKAGQRSLTHSALKEAAAQLARALDLIKALPGTPVLRREQIQLQIALANALMHTKGYAAPETKGALDRARVLVEQAETLGEPPEDPLLLLSVLHGFWVANHVAFNGDAVRELAVKFMALAQTQKTVFPLVLAHRVMGTSLLYLGEITEGREHLDRSLLLYDPAGHRQLATRFGQDAGVAVLSNRPLALWLLGYPEAALKDADDALNQARDIGQTATFLYALTRIAWFHLVIGNYETAAAQSRELLAVTEDMEGSYWKAAATMLQGCLFALTGNGTPAIDMITAGIRASRLSGWNLLRMPWYLSCLASAHVTIGQFDEAKRCILEAMNAMATTKESWPESEILRVAGDLELMSSEPDREKAQAYYKRALVIAREQKAKSWELRAAMGLARLWRDQGKRQEASDVLVPVYDWFTQGLDTPDLRDAKRLIAELA